MRLTIIFVSRCAPGLFVDRGETAPEAIQRERDEYIARDDREDHCRDEHLPNGTIGRHWRMVIGRGELSGL